MYCYYFCTTVLENITGDISFKCKHNRLFSNFFENWKYPHFTIKIFQILSLSLTCYLLRVVDRLINASTWYLWSRKISANEGFRQLLLNNERATVLSLMDTNTSNLLVKINFDGDFQKSVLYCENLYQKLML